MTDTLKACPYCAGLVDDTNCHHHDRDIAPEIVEKAREAWLNSASDYTRLDESIRAALEAVLPDLHAAWEKEQKP